jgi:hypothetical protein
MYKWTEGVTQKLNEEELDFAIKVQGIVETQRQKQLDAVEDMKKSGDIDLGIYDSIEKAQKNHEELQKELTTFKNKQLTRAEKQLDELSKLNKLEKEALEVAKQSHTFAMTDIAPLNKIVDDAVTKNDDTVSGSVIVKHIATLKIKRLEIAKLIKHHEQQNELTKNDSSASELRETNNNIIQKLTEYNKNCEIAIDRYTRYLNEIQSRGDKKQKTTKTQILMLFVTIIGTGIMLAYKIIE